MNVRNIWKNNPIAYFTEKYAKWRSYVLSTLKGVCTVTNWYIFFVVTGQEESIANQLNFHFQNELFTAFVPLLETLFKKSGRVDKEIKVMFPGYVFVEAELGEDDFVKYTSQIMSVSKNIIRLLNYGSSKRIALYETERKLLIDMFNDSYCIETSHGFIEGDKIYIESGPLKGLESKITKVDRHKREAILTIEMLGALRDVKVGLDVLRKV